MKFKIISLVIFFTSNAWANNSSPAQNEERRKVGSVAYAASDSICLDGLVAALSGHSCKNIHFGERANFKYTVECTDVTEEDHVTKGMYVVIENPIKQSFVRTGFDTMCVDANLAILRETNIK